MRRRDFLASMGAAAAAVAAGRGLVAADAPATGSAETQPEAPKVKKTHIITLSFDDGFKRSSIRTAEIYEKHKLSACMNVIATGHLKSFSARDPYQQAAPMGDFKLWNELRQRSHEIMPHGLRHANLKALPLAEAKGLITQCLEIFAKELKGFDAKQAVFNFPYNASTPELEQWLATVVRAFRTGGDAVNPWPKKGQVKVTCRSSGPGNCEAVLDREIERFLAKDSGWLVFNLHGLDEEGWGPVRASYLDALLGRLTAIKSVDVLPARAALTKYAG